MDASSLKIGKELIVVGGYERIRPSPICKMVVCKIGREYFYVAPALDSPKHIWLRFHKENGKWAGDSCTSYSLYETLDQYKNITLHRYKYDKIERFFRRYASERKIDDETVDKIYGILVEKQAIPDESEQVLCEIDDRVQ